MTEDTRIDDLMKDIDTLKAIIKKQKISTHQREKRELKSQIDVLVKMQEELIMENNSLRHVLDNCVKATLKTLSTDLEAEVERKKSTKVNMPIKRYGKEVIPDMTISLYKDTKEGS